MLSTLKNYKNFLNITILCYVLDGTTFLRGIYVAHLRSVFA